MGKITVFTLDDCSNCHKIKQILEAKGAAFTEISLTKTPEWRSLLFLLANGHAGVPQVFFNSRHVGGIDEIEELERQGVLGDRLKECLEGEGEGEEFPPPLRTPSNEEYLQIIPAELRSKWQQYAEDLDSPLGGTSDRPISSIVITLEVPDAIVVVSTAGPAKEIFTAGAAVQKGAEGSQQKAYCQVAIEKKASLFVNDPTKVPGLEKNDLYLKLGYGYYAGVPWTAGHNRGTVVALEKEGGILKPEHLVILEATRDKIEAELTQHHSSH